MNDVTTTAYEKWVITCGASRPVREALKGLNQKIEVCRFAEFVEHVLKGIDDWRAQAGRKSTTTLPSDKWLLWQLDMLNHFKVIRRRRIPLVAFPPESGPPPRS